MGFESQLLLKGFSRHFGFGLVLLPTPAKWDSSFAIHSAAFQVHLKWMLVPSGDDDDDDDDDDQNWKINKKAQKTQWAQSRILWLGLQFIGHSSSRLLKSQGSNVLGSNTAEHNYAVLTIVYRSGWMIFWYFTNQQLAGVKSFWKDSLTGATFQGYLVWHRENSPIAKYMDTFTAPFCYGGIYIYLYIYIHLPFFSVPVHLASANLPKASVRLWSCCWRLARSASATNDLEHNWWGYVHGWWGYKSCNSNKKKWTTYVRSTWSCRNIEHEATMKKPYWKLCFWKNFQTIPYCFPCTYHVLTKLPRWITNW